MPIMATFFDYFFSLVVAAVLCFGAVQLRCCNEEVKRLETEAERARAGWHGVYEGGILTGYYRWHQSSGLYVWETSLRTGPTGSVK